MAPESQGHVVLGMSLSLSSWHGRSLQLLRTRSACVAAQLVPEPRKLTGPDLNSPGGVPLAQNHTFPRWKTVTWYPN